MGLFAEKFIELAKNSSPLEDLWKRYSEPHRFYHNLDHLESGLRAHFSLFNHITPQVFFAWAYHDSVYNPLAQDNEERSAALLYEDSKVLGLDFLDVEAAMEMIWNTKLNARKSSIVNDIDLSILGQPPEIYNEYRANIRREYPVDLVPDEMFYPARAHVLKTLLERAPIYKTPEFFNAFEVQATDNVIGEIREIQKDGILTA